MQRAGRTVSEANESDQAGDVAGTHDALKSRIERLIRWTGPVLLVLVAGVPLLRRLRHPTLQGDDLIRIVDLIEQPFRELLFLPLAEHVAPLFQVVSWATWQLIGHDVRLAPLAFCLASVAAWALCLRAGLLAGARDGLAHRFVRCGGSRGTITARQGNGLVVFLEQFFLGDRRNSGWGRGRSALGRGLDGRWP